MARKKDPPKPLFAVKHDFYTSLDHFIDRAMVLYQAADTLMTLGVIKADSGVGRAFQQKLDALRDAMMSKD